MPKQTSFNVGIYLRLSKDDERAGESVSIENQRTMLIDYVDEHPDWTLHDVYIDDGYSGTNFERPSVQRLLDDAKTGKINLILVKDLSRFGRNYIEVGQYIDYIFPSFNIRFIALSDNIDTFDRNSTAMDMMPIMNIFNEWHAANTSKKQRAVIKSNAKAGKYKCVYTAYGYTKGDDDKHTPVIDPEASAVVYRIFEMRVNGAGYKKIADTLNKEKILMPLDYLCKKEGKENPSYCFHLWSSSTVKNVLKNSIYVGRMELLKTTTVSYKNHKRIINDESDRIIIEHNHEAIVTQEMWDKVREMERSLSRGKRDSKGELAPLSGLLFCNTCGSKMKQNGGYGSKKSASYLCGRYARVGKEYCNPHNIQKDFLEATVLADIRRMADFVVDEEKARKYFLSRKQAVESAQASGTKKRENEIRKRLANLDKLIQSTYEEKILGEVPKEMCNDLLNKYQQEKNELQAELNDIEKRSEKEKKQIADVDEFIRRIKQYAGAETLTRSMCMELIEYVTVDESYREKIKRPREIHIYYKLIDEAPNSNKNIYL